MSLDALPASWDQPIAGAPDFTLAELTHSDTAQAQGLDNRPPQEAAQRLCRLARQVLQPLRERFGPLRITSGYRSPELNKLVGGSPRSHHCLGQAADFKPLGEQVPLLAMVSHICHHLPYEELVAESPPQGWLHVALVPDQEPARLLKVCLAGGKSRPTTLEELGQLYAAPKS